MKVYDILLHTPIGKRKGELKASMKNGEVIGFLSLFGNTEPLEGTVDENGECRLRGRFATLMKSVEFTADGHIDGDAIRLTVQGDRRSYPITGKLRKQEEG